MLLLSHPKTCSFFSPTSRTYVYVQQQHIGIHFLTMASLAALTTTTVHELLFFKWDYVCTYTGGHSGAFMWQSKTQKIKRNSTATANTDKKHHFVVDLVPKTQKLASSIIIPHPGLIFFLIHFSEWFQSQKSEQVFGAGHVFGCGSKKNENQFFFFFFFVPNWSFFHRHFSD